MNIEIIIKAANKVRADLDQLTEYILKAKDDAKQQAPITVESANCEEVAWRQNVDNVVFVWVTGYADEDKKQSLFSEKVIGKQEYEVPEKYQSVPAIHFEIKPFIAKVDGSPDWDYGNANAIPKLWVNPKATPQPSIDLGKPATPAIVQQPKVIEKGREVIKLAELEHVKHPIPFDGKGKKDFTLENTFVDINNDGAVASYLKAARKLKLRRCYFRNGVKAYNKNRKNVTLLLRHHDSIDAEDVGAEGGFCAMKLDNNKSARIRGFVATRAHQHNWQMIMTADRPEHSGFEFSDFIVHGLPYLVHKELSGRGSMDLMNMYDCSGLLERRIRIHDGFVYNGWGNNGSGIPLGDGGDIGVGNTGRQGGRQHLQRVAFYGTANKATAISGGGGNLVEDVVYYQDDTFPQSEFANMGAYIGDFDNMDQEHATNGKDTGFTNNIFRRVRGTWILADGRPNHFEDITKGYVSKRKGIRIFADQRANPPILEDCEFGKITAKEVLDHGEKFSKRAPMFIDLDGQPIVLEPTPIAA